MTAQEQYRRRENILAFSLLAAGLATRLFKRYGVQPLQDGYLSKYYTYAQLIHSNLATAHMIENTPSPEVIEAAKYFAQNTLDPLTEMLGYTLKQPGNSWFRTGELTNLIYTGSIGGYKKSDHEKGFAMDLDSPGNINNHEIIYTILNSKIPFKQLILEKGSLEVPQWIHLSVDPDNNTGQILYLNASDEYEAIDRSSLETLYGI